MNIGENKIKMFVLVKIDMINIVIFKSRYFLWLQQLHLFFNFFLFVYNIIYCVNNNMSTSNADIFFEFFI